MKYKQFEKGTGVLNDMAAQCLEDSERWFGDVGTNNIVHHTLGMCGEVGEFANLVKKVDRGSLDLGDAITRNQLAQELTDTFVYMLNLAGLLKIDLEKVYTVVRSQNEHRFMAARRAREAQG